MAIVTSPVTVKAAAVTVIPLSEHPATYTVKNSGAQTVTLSRSAAVTSAHGFDVAAGATTTVTLGAGEELFGICAAGKETTVEAL